MYDSGEDSPGGDRVALGMPANRTMARREARRGPVIHRVKLGVVVLGAVLVGGYAAPMIAQEDICRPATGSNEAKTFAILSIPIAFSGGRAPSPAHGIVAGLEAASLPNVDPTTATPTTCRPGKGPENANPLPGILRPRIWVALGGFVVEASWIPPIPVKGVKANLVGLAVAGTVGLPKGWYAGVRAHAVVGALHAPVVCDKDALLDATSECYGGTLSNDRWAPNIYGVEAVLATPPGPIRLHGGFGYSRLQPRFQVDFTNALGSRDRRKVEVNLQRAAVVGGITYQVGRFDLTAEGYATFVDAVSVRFVLQTRLGK